MKKLLLTLLAVVLCVGVSVAQRRTSTQYVRLGFIDEVKCTYSYIPSGRSEIWDGPVTMSGASEKSEWVNYQVGYFQTKASYKLSANNRNSLLNGPISMNYQYDATFSRYDSKEKGTISLKGAYVNGLPNGSFVYSFVKNGEAVADIKVTYNMGCFTGPFRFIDRIYDNNNPSTYTTGTFTNDGKPTGKWSVWYYNKYTSARTEETNYEFLNGVLVGGDKMAKDPSVVNYAKMYATKKITKEKLFAAGIMLQEQYLNVYGATAKPMNIYKEVARVMSEYVNYEDVGSKSDKSEKVPEAIMYTRVFKAPYLSDKDLERFFEQLGRSGYLHLPKVLKTYDGIEDNYVVCHNEIYMQKPYGSASDSEWKLTQNYDDREWGYFITKEQRKRVEEFVKKQNRVKIDEWVKNMLGSQYFKVEERPFYVMSYTLVDDETVEFNGVPRGSKKGTPYSTYRAKVGYDEEYSCLEWATSFTRIRNKYDDIKALRSELNKADNNAESVAEKIYNSGEVNDYREEFAAQLKSFIDYQNSRKSIAIDHDNLDNTINSYKQHIRITKRYASYLKYFAKSHKLKAEIQQKGISKYTTTTSPTFPDWNRNITLKEVIRVVTEQKNILSKWDELNELKSSAAKNHSEISAAGIPVLSVYNGLYSSIAKAKVSLDESIASYKGLLNTQTSVTDYIPLYKEVVNNNTLLATALKPAKCAAKAYKTYYKALDLTWKQQDVIESINKVLATQKQLKDISQRPTLKDDEKRVKKLKLTALDDIIKAYNGTPSVQPTTVVKQPEPKAVVTDKKVEAQATEEKRSDVAPSTKAEKRPQSQSLATIQRGFGQYVEISPMFNSISSCNDSFSTHINYIAGYRFNKNLFLGVGTGVNLNFGHNTLFYVRGGGSWNHYDVHDASLAMFSIPVYLHFRVDFGKRAKLWNPYASISAGAQFGILEPYQHLADRFYNGSLPGSPVFHPLHMIDNELSNHTKRNKEGFVSLDFGANRRLTDKLSIYFGVGYKVGLRNDIRAMVEDSSSSIYTDTALSHSIKLNIGLSF